MKDMSTTKTHDATLPRPLRLWPGVVLAIALMLARYVVPLFAGEATIFEFPVALLAIFAGIGVRGCDRRLVDVLQPRAVVGPPGRAPRDDRRTGGDQVRRASVDRRRRDGETWLTFWRSRP